MNQEVKQYKRVPPCELLGLKRRLGIENLVNRKVSRRQRFSNKRSAEENDCSTQGFGARGFLRVTHKVPLNQFIERVLDMLSIVRSTRAAGFMNVGRVKRFHGSIPFMSSFTDPGKPLLQKKL